LYKFALFILVFFTLVACNDSKKKQEKVVEDLSTTTYYLIRHAEKDRSDPSNKNPKLTEEGILRARNWATYFEDIKIDQIFSTDYNRTQETAAYTASNKKVMVESYDPSNLYDDDFRILTNGNNILIVGHSNTTPQFVNAIIGEKKYSDIADDENGLLYIVKIHQGVKNVEVLAIN
jgi:2,3-bisphosphoglycerate-dependent phosphoglycerate mutase